MKLILKVIAVFFIGYTLESCALLSAAGISSQGQPVIAVDGKLENVSTISEIEVDHSSWDRLLKKYVDQKGFVDYKGFAQDRGALQEYVDLLSSLEPSNKWSVQELLAYYINLYNAHTVLLIVDNYPVKSIKDINGPWTRGIVPIGDKNLSLGGIENGILRKMNEPRIHFAINCASISCPRLLNEAFVGSKINDQLDVVTSSFINGDKNEVSESDVQLSSIFDWYGKDYIVKGKEDVIGYINQYSNVKIESDAVITFKEYNWNLNEQQ